MDTDPTPVDNRQRVHRLLKRAETTSLGVLGNLQRQTRLELVLSVLEKRVLERTHMSYPLEVFILHCWSHSPAATSRPVLGGGREDDGDEEKEKVKYQRPTHVFVQEIKWKTSGVFDYWEICVDKKWSDFERMRRVWTILGNLGDRLCVYVCIQIVCFAIKISDPSSVFSAYTLFFIVFSLEGIRAEEAEHFNSTYTHNTQ